ncbi:MAG: acyl-CoA thioesterase [Fibrobacteria bacterium]|nr:acyl-CoA thioesterase [Fibrobacteria bacterium]
MDNTNIHLSEIAVRYAETDAMGFVYYGNYLTWFEVARCEALAAMGHPYAEMEKQNIFIPVLSAEIQYKKPAKFGDIIKIESLRYRLGRVRIQFNYRVLKGDELLTTGKTVHAFMNSAGRAIRPPEEILEFFPEQG